jgi:hypothetical protein
MRTPSGGWAPSGPNAWILIVNHQHLHRVLTAYLQHYNTGRPHRGLGLALPEPAPARA